jgi:hypothetical protein
MLKPIFVYWEQKANSTRCMPWYRNGGDSKVADGDADSIFKRKIASRRLDEATWIRQHAPP